MTDLISAGHGLRSQPAAQRMQSPLRGRDKAAAACSARASPALRPLPCPCRAPGTAPRAPVPPAPRLREGPGWSGHGRVPPAHTPGPLSAKRPLLGTETLCLCRPPAPPSVFCCFYQERGDFLFSFFLPPVSRKDPKCRAQGRALLRVRTFVTCEDSLGSSAHTALAFSYTCVALVGTSMCNETCFPVAGIILGTF